MGLSEIELKLELNKLRRRIIETALYRELEIERYTLQNLMAKSRIAEIDEKHKEREQTTFNWITEIEKMIEQIKK